MSNYEPSRYLTEKGIIALKHRLLSYIDVYNKNRYPFKARMFGLLFEGIEDKQECWSRIKEILELTGSKINIVEYETDRNHIKILEAV